MTATVDLLFVTNIPTPYRTAFFNSLDEACQGRGLRLRVIYCARIEPRRTWPFEPAENRYRHEFLPGWSPTVRSTSFPTNPGILGRLAALRPRVTIHAGSWNMPTNLLALATRGHGTRLFWSEGHADAALHRDGPIARLRARALGRYGGFVVPNGKSADWLRPQLTRDVPFHLLPNTVDEDFFRRTNGSQRAEARQALRLAADERVLVQVAALEERKGGPELARAFAAAPLRDGARLVFVGAGPLEAELSDISARCKGGMIQLTGDIDRTQVRNWLWAADAFALNTRRDPNPLSPIEASFAGLPLLLSAKAGNYDELLQDGVTGFGIADPAQPGPALGRLLAAPPAQLEAMGAAAARNAEDRFRRRAVADALLDSLAGDLRGGQ